MCLICHPVHKYNIFTAVNIDTYKNAAMAAMAAMAARTKCKSKYFTPDMCGEGSVISGAGGQAGKKNVHF